MGSATLNPYFDRSVGPPLVGVFSLGVYRDGADREAGRHARAVTTCGLLLQQSKYNVTSEHTRGLAIERLTDLLCSSIRERDELAGVEAIVAAPSTGSGFSEELAQCVAEGSELALHLGVNRFPGSLSRKSGGHHRSYRIDASLPAGRVLLLDDVIDEGVTIRALGLAALEAGATECVGLAVARVLRG